MCGWSWVQSWQYAVNIFSTCTGYEACVVMFSMKSLKKQGDWLGHGISEQLKAWIGVEWPVALINWPIEGDELILVPYIEERRWSVLSELAAKDLVVLPQMKPYFRGMRWNNQSASRGGAKLMYMNLVLNVHFAGTSKNVNKTPHYLP
jgi:hypothetical protein